MTLKEMINTLEMIEGHTPICKLYNPHSYTGNPEYLSFEIDPNSIIEANTLLNDCNKLMGSTLTGYRSGIYTIKEDTPIWVAEYGSMGRALYAIQLNGKIILGDYD